MGFKVAHLPAAPASKERRGPAPARQPGGPGGGPPWLVQLLLALGLICAGAASGRFWSIDTRVHERETQESSGAGGVPCVLSDSSLSLLRAAAKCQGVHHSGAVRRLLQQHLPELGKEGAPGPSSDEGEGEGEEGEGDGKEEEEGEGDGGDSDKEGEGDGEGADSGPGEKARLDGPRRPMKGLGGEPEGACALELQTVKGKLAEAQDSLAKAGKEHGTGLDCPPCASKPCPACPDSATACANASAVAAGVGGPVQLLRQENADVLRMDAAEMVREIEDLRLLVGNLRHQNKHLLNSKRELESACKPTQGGEEATAKLMEAQGELNSTRWQLSVCLLRSGKASNKRLLQEIASLEKRLNESSAAGCPEHSGGDDQELVGGLQRDLNATKDALSICLSNVGNALGTKLWKELSRAQLKLRKVQEDLKKARESGRAPCPEVAQEAATDCQALKEWKGYKCSASSADLQAYSQYTVGGPCPDDWPLVQRLLLQKGCPALPLRRCRARTPAKPAEPLALPGSLFAQEALADWGVQWQRYECKSFECVLRETQGTGAGAPGDSPGLSPRCQRCFNLTAESRRWGSKARGAIPMDAALALKNGSIRTGLDVGGGSGSFAAHMAQRGVTILTATSNLDYATPLRPTEGTQQARVALPLTEAVALRGLIPLHAPLGARLPLSDGVLDLVHWGVEASPAPMALPPLRFQEVLYEWDRVLRVGGVLWLDPMMFMLGSFQKYSKALKQLGYKKLYWTASPKADGVHVFLNCVLEKTLVPVRLKSSAAALSAAKEST